MKILIVDDNHDDRAMLRYALEAHEHEVMEAVNGQEGLQTASAHRFDLIISDGLMPVMDGFQFLRMFRKSSSLPFVFYSAAYDGDSDKQLALSLGANGYLLKPMDPLELLQEIERIMSETPQERTETLKEDSEYLKSYSQVVFAKLEDKVRELEASLAERKRTEEQLKAREREFRTLAENSPDNIARYDTRCCMIYVNPRMEKTLGIPAAHLLGKTPMDKHPGQVRSAYQERIRQVLITGQEAEIDLILPDTGQGEQYHNIRFVAELGDDGSVAGVLAIGRDITERKQAEQRLYEKQQRINDMALELTLSEERERRRIAVDLHDTLGQDLTLIRMKLGEMSKTALSAGQKLFVSDIKDLTDGAINRVRSLTKLLCPPVLESAGLEAALKWLARQIETDYGLQIAFSDDLQDKMVARDIQMELYTSVRELLINIAKHAGTPTACLTVCREADALVIRVEDDGMGFEAENVLNGLHSDGFGLFSIKRRITYMGGSLQITSKPGSGTEVVINVPLAGRLALGAS